MKSCRNCTDKHGVKIVNPCPFCEPERFAAVTIGRKGGAVTGKSKSRGDSDYYKKLIKKRWDKYKADEKKKAGGVMKKEKESPVVCVGCGRKYANPDTFDRHAYNCPADKKTDEKKKARGK